MPASIIRDTDIEAALNWRGFRLYQPPYDYHEPPEIHHHELPLPPPIHHHELPLPPPIHHHELPPPEADGVRSRNVWIAFGLLFGYLGLAVYEEEV